MYDAEVGDDVYGEDPSVNELQAYAADHLGTEAALFVPSGTMANQVCLHVLTDPGDEIILEQGAHVFNYETGAAGALSGIQLHPVEGDRGLLHPNQVAAAVRPEAVVAPRTRVLSIENTANKAGGIVYPIDRVEDIVDTARDHDLRLHLDGARLWNAAVALDVPERRLVEPFDLSWVALSKGLGAPVGSLIVGPASLINEARRTRKRLGGGMRQAGVLAAAGLYALKNHRTHLAADHEKASRLAEGLSEGPMFRVDRSSVQTNIVMFDVTDRTASSVVETLEEEGVRLTPFGPQTIRATTHRDVSMADIEDALDAVHRCFG